MATRTTDNRLDWARKVLASSIPQHEVPLAESMMLLRAKFGESYLFDPLPHIEPRRIARNWYRQPVTDKL